MAPDCGQLLQGIEQRQMAFGEVGLLHRPVVHFGVDVVGVLAVPGGRVGIVPQALQVGRLAAGPAARDHQVAAELEEQCHQRGIAAVGEGGDAFVRRQFAAGGVRRDRARRGGRALMVGDVLRAQRVVSSCRGRRPDCWTRAVRVGRDIVVVLEIGSAGQDQGGCRSRSVRAFAKPRLVADGRVRPPARTWVGVTCTWCGLVSFAVTSRRGPAG